MNVFSTADDLIHAPVDEPTTLVVGDTGKKKWIELPAELGGGRAAVKETVTDMLCVCCSHYTTMYILQGKYSTMACPGNGWAWASTPPRKMIDKMRRKPK